MDIEQARIHAEAVLHPKVFRGVSTESRELAQDILNALEEIDRLRKNDQDYMDRCIYYRNLAIDLGAKSTEMIDDYDKGLCEKWASYQNDDDHRFQWERDEQKAAWKQLEDAEAEIKRLTVCLEQANKQFEHFEREWYLRGDEIERLEAMNMDLAAQLAEANRERR